MPTDRQLFGQRYPQIKHSTAGTQWQHWYEAKEMGKKPISGNGLVIAAGRNSGAMRLDRGMWLERDMEMGWGWD
jgi:hypothetical protein